MIIDGRRVRLKEQYGYLKGIAVVGIFILAIAVITVLK